MTGLRQKLVIFALMLIAAAALLGCGGERAACFNEAARIPDPADRITAYVACGTA